MANQAASDAVLEPLHAYSDGIRFRLGLEFRLPREQPSSAGTPLPARYLNVQIASPPPDRVRGGRSSEWFDGLLVDDGKGPRGFRPNSSDWEDFAVFPAADIPQLGTPDPATLLFDQRVAVPAVPATEALTSVFKIAGPRRGDTAIISVRYQQPILKGTPLDLAGVSYYLQDEFEFEFGSARDRYLAVSFEQFQPERRRRSADYILKIKERGSITEPPEGPAKIERWW